MSSGHPDPGRLGSPATVFGLTRKDGPRLAEAAVLM